MGSRKEGDWLVKYRDDNTGEIETCLVEGTCVDQVRDRFYRAYELYDYTFISANRLKRD